MNAMDIVAILRILMIVLMCITMYFAISVIGESPYVVNYKNWKALHSFFACVALWLILVFICIFIRASYKYDGKVEYAYTKNDFNDTYEYIGKCIGYELSTEYSVKNNDDSNNCDWVLVDSMTVLDSRFEDTEETIDFTRPKRVYLFDEMLSDELLFKP